MENQSLKENKTSTDTDNLCLSPLETASVENKLLKSINDKLGILELVSKDIKELKMSLEMIDKKAATMEKEINKKLIRN